MSDAVKPQEPAVPPAMQLIQMASAYWVSRIVHVAADLGLADHLAHGPLSAADIAGKAGLNAPALHRLMRSLAGLGILDEGDDGRFGLTPLYIGFTDVWDAARILERVMAERLWDQPQFKKRAAVT